SGDAPEKVRDLDDGQRHEAAQPMETAGERRRGSGEQQHRAADERRERQQMRRDPRRPSPENAPRSGDAFPLLEELGRRKEKRRDEERQQVIDRPERDERTEDRRRGKERTEKKKDDRFEDSQAAGNVAGDAGDLREEEDRQEPGE